jgi:2-polyprenyl-3-methyl-5-hydroxy-6-metoxy-1,4-benzoquinol methylase
MAEPHGGGGNPGPDSPYIFGDAETDRYRLETQTRLFSDYIRKNAHRFAGDNVNSILDLGCGEGQLGFVLREVYPQAHLVGIDKDEKAIVVAKSKAAALGVANVEFVVGNIEEALPPGPFDLVYASIVMIHTRAHQRIAELVKDSLRPGGHFWIKDLDATGVINAYELPSYKKVAGMWFETLARVGAHPYVADELPELLKQAGFEDIEREDEIYPLGGNSEAGRAMLAITMGAVYNGRALMSKVIGVPEQDIVKLYLDVINTATLAKGEIGAEKMVNIIARQPA